MLPWQQLDARLCNVKAWLWEFPFVWTVTITKSHQNAKWPQYRYENSDTVSTKDSADNTRPGGAARAQNPPEDPLKECTRQEGIYILFDPLQSAHSHKQGSSWNSTRLSSLGLY